MQIGDLLKLKRADIKERWLDLVISSYPADSRNFFKKQKNQFSNPVGAALERQIDTLYDSLIGNTEKNDTAAILEDFIRIRSVQEFTAAQATGYILNLKQAVREVLADDIRTSQLFSQLLALETRIDGILLEAFDVYMRSREKIYQIKADELKRRSYFVLRKLNKDLSKQKPADDSDNHSPN